MGVGILHPWTPHGVKNAHHEAHEAHEEEPKGFFMAFMFSMVIALGRHAGPEGPASCSALCPERSTMKLMKHMKKSGMVSSCPSCSSW
jgi:hypothetical protein